MRNKLIGKVEAILNDNCYALGLITGKNPRRIEGWLQVELAKDLSKSTEFVTDVFVEKFSHDIVATHLINGSERKFGVEMKIGLTAPKAKRDLSKLRIALDRGYIQDGYFLFLYLLKEIYGKYVDCEGDSAYQNQLCELGFMREFSGYEEDVKSWKYKEVEPRQRRSCRCLIIGCVKILPPPYLISLIGGLIPSS